MKIKTGIGQDSHRFSDNPEKILKLGGLTIENECALEGNSDADVVLHAITNAVSCITGRNILGKIADELCSKGHTDSRIYLKEALKDLGEWNISGIGISLEAARPKMSPHIKAMKKTIAALLHIDSEDVGITATSGEKLTAFGKGEGIQAFAILTVTK